MANPSEQTLDPLGALNPLKVLVVANARDRDEEEYFRGISRAFEGGVSQHGSGDFYYASGESLGIQVRRIDLMDKDAHLPDIKEMLETCGTILVVLLLSKPVDRTSTSGKWLQDLGELSAAPQFTDRISVLPVAVNRKARLLAIPSIAVYQWLEPESFLGEEALRSVHLALFVLQRSWELLGSNTWPRGLTLFLSHAKRDGAPFATSLKTYIGSLSWMRGFYDADDISPGTRWHDVLESGVMNSVLIVLRTDVYDQRAYCVQEIEWSRKFKCPAVIVDLRKSTDIAREALPVGDLSTVRVTDGNLLRILSAAIREAVRVRAFERRIRILEDAGLPGANRTIAIPRVSVDSIGVVLEQVPENERGAVEFVVTPERMPSAIQPVAKTLVEAYCGESTELCVPEDLIDRVRRGVDQ